MRTKLILILIVFLTSLSSTLLAEDITIKGTVTDNSREPIIGVSVQLKGTSRGTVTDIYGFYTITVPKNSTLRFNYVGFVSKEVVVKKSGDLNIILKEDDAMLDEVVISGYESRKSKKSTSAGSVSFVPPAIMPEAVISERVEMRSMDEMSYIVEDRKDYSRNQNRGGLLTATEVNDFKKWDEWAPMLQGEFSSYQNIWKIVPKTRFVATAVDKNRKPMPNVVVTLYDASQKAIWTAKTDNTGTAQLWADYIIGQQSVQSIAPYSIRFTYNNDTKTINKAQPYPQQTNVAEFNTQNKVSNQVDIFFTIDATGSMGDELRYLQTELYDIINRVQQNQSQLGIRMGSLVYRDKGDEYLTRSTPLSSDITATIDFLKKQHANGGGDYPEAIDEALYQTIEKENWNETALSRIVFIILDAPAHEDATTIRRLQEQIQLAAKKGIRIVPLVASGMDKSGEYLMRSIALATNGTYVTLTDDSGVGGSHIKPSTEYSKVEKMNDLVVRLINEYTKVPSTI